MNLAVFESIKDKSEYLAVVGLGYVGLTVAVAFADQVKTLGFDIDEGKIADYKQGIDRTQEIGSEKLSSTSLEFTTDPARLREAKVIIVAVPTPVNSDKTPNLNPVINVSALIGRNLTCGTIVVFESTVYPGVTEEVCLPILEQESGLKCGLDFKVGYSPERINPGDKIHRLENIRKIVSGVDDEAVANIAAIYELIIHAGVYQAPSIKVAEAAKLAENAQRDINIAFMNELSMVFDRVGINTKEVVDAMNIKWNALGFYPGLVGGHCIGIDPYYFIYQAERLGYHSQIMAAGRKINDNMAVFVSDNLIKRMIQADINVKHASIYIMGITFKEDCPDMRNSKAVDVCKQLATYGINVKVVDPVVNEKEFKAEFGVEPVALSAVQDADCLVFLVAHQQFKALQSADLVKMFKPRQKQSKHVLLDIKNIFDHKSLKEQGYYYWSL